MVKLKEEWKTKWIAALRSGQYKQGQKCLRTADDCFCCLGVLCDLIDNTGWESEPKVINGISSYRYSLKNYNDCPSLGNLPVRARKMVWEQYDDYNSSYNADVVMQKLISLNDDKNLNFNKIADYIEENL